MDLKQHDHSCIETSERTIYSVDLYSEGLAFGHHKIPGEALSTEHLYLRLTGIHDHLRLQSKYGLSGRAVQNELIQQLSRLSSRGQLASAEITLGVAHDPFEGHGGHFAHALSLLEVFRKFRPRRLLIQTRSPLVVIGMPALKALGDTVRVVMGIETPQEDSVLKFTPGLARVSERIKAVRALKQFGVPCAVQAAPVMPYGDWRADAPAFAKMLAELEVPIIIPVEAQQFAARGGMQRAGLVAKRLAEARAFFYLRPDSAEPLRQAVRAIAPDRLVSPVPAEVLPQRQLSLFVA